MTDELLESAQQHGVTAADYVAAQLYGEGMTPGRAGELLNTYLLNQAYDRMANGTSRRISLNGSEPSRLGSTSAWQSSLGRMRRRTFGNNPEPLLLWCGPPT
jgi:hypothetical protein